MKKAKVNTSFGPTMDINRGFQVPMPNYNNKKSLLITASLVDVIWSIANDPELAKEHGWNLSYLRGACVAIAGRLVDPEPLTDEDIEEGQKAIGLQLVK